MEKPRRVLIASNEELNGDIKNAQTRFPEIKSRSPALKPKRHQPKYDNKQAALHLMIQSSNYSPSLRSQALISQINNTAPLSKSVMQRNAVNRKYAS